MNRFLDSLPFPVLIIMALLLGSAPMGGEPHLIEKINMLMAGILVKPLDMFDLLLHSTPVILLLLKSFYWLKSKDNNNSSQEL